MAKVERKFLTEIKNSLKKDGAFFHKIPDMPHFAGSGFRFDLKKPFDAIALFFSHAIAIEAKYIPKHRAFGLKDLLPHQILGLDEWHLAGGHSWVFLNVKQKKNAATNTPFINKVYTFEWGAFKAKGRYSKAELLACYSVDCQKGIYNLGPWLDEFLF